MTQPESVAGKWYVSRAYPLRRSHRRPPAWIDEQDRLAGPFDSLHEAKYWITDNECKDGCAWRFPDETEVLCNE